MDRIAMSAALARGYASADTVPVAVLEAIGSALLAWYARNRRDLPWRRSRDAYRIWVSEIMLQQTQVATVIAYYERWLQRFPDLPSLARADTDAVLQAWEGLGYYSRARNMLRTARQVLDDHGGQLPRSIEELRRLPGIGRYSAGAIASIAYGADEPAVDGNIVRVLTRLFCLEGDPRRAPLAERIWQLARRLIPEGQSTSFNQALMELGATCCAARSPGCSSCPVAAHCAAHERGEVTRFPEPSPRPLVLQEARAVGVVWRGRRVLLGQLPAGAPRWAGLWQFPDAALASGADAAQALRKGLKESTALDAEVLTLRATVKHQVTRFRITLSVHDCRAPGGRARPVKYAALRWCTLEQLAALAMPAPHRKIARGLLAAC